MTFVLAFLVHLLPLPPHATIDPFGARPLMSVARDSRVAATVIIGGFSTRTVVWNATGGWHLAPAPAFPSTPSSIELASGGFDGDALLLNASANYTGPVPRTRYRAGELAGTTVSTFDFGTCAYPRNSSGAQVAGRYEDGDLIATMQSPPLVDIDDLSGQIAPVVVRLRGGVCTYLGNGIAIAAAGTYAAGYAGYFGNVPQSDVAVKQHFVALRWSGDERHEIGDGVALAINASGVAVGAGAPPGSDAFGAPTPHARLWPLSGDPVDLVSSSQESVAYAVDARGRAAGMLVGDDGRHYAFVWENGRVQRLDDVVKAPGWRFECAYAFGPNGQIAGIGTYRDTASAFVIDGF